QDTLNRKRDPDKGRYESDLIQALQEQFERLKQAIDEASMAHFDDPTNSSPRSAAIVQAVSELWRTSGDLQEAIYQDLFRRTTDAKTHYRNSLLMVLSTSILGIVLMSSLLRFFYRWVFYPVRDLEQGVNRVAEGDFEHRIEVHSGDEMEDLAAAFND